MYSYKLESSTDTFKKNVTIEFPYDSSKITKSIGIEDALTVSYYSDASKSWVEVPAKIDTKKSTISVETNHFSWWIVNYIPEYFTKTRKEIYQTSTHFKIYYNPEDTKYPNASTSISDYKDTNL
jgi:hypothetical protein